MRSAFRISGDPVCYLCTLLVVYVHKTYRLCVCVCVFVCVSVYFCMLKNIQIHTPAVQDIFHPVFLSHFTTGKVSRVFNNDLLCGVMAKI